MTTQEQERLKRLREKQLQSRDPLAKQRQFQHSSSIKEKRMRKPFSMSKAWKDIPHVVKIPFYALILGVIVVFVLPTFWNSPYAVYAGAGITLVMIIFGVILGNSLDMRDEIKDHIK